MPVEFYALACHFCEFKKAKKDVFWHIYASTPTRERSVGWMTTAEMESYSRVRKSRSSTNCPPCGSRYLGYSSVKAYKDSLVAKIDEHDWMKDVVSGVVQFEMYQAKNNTSGGQYRT